MRDPSETGLRSTDMPQGVSAEERVRNELISFVRGNPQNRFPDGDGSYFDEPLVGFAAANDRIFSEYKYIIGAFHRTPEEALREACGSEARAATVVCWILPITKKTRESNRREMRLPSRRWAETRNFGEPFNSALRRHMVDWLGGLGYPSVAPQLSPGWKYWTDTPVGIASTWSERHAAYAAGLGTFGLNDALITPKGISHRCGSVVTALRLTPTPRPYPDFHHNCLHYRDGSCGACISRCPAGALSREGHDKIVCGRYLHETVAAAVGERYGVTEAGCGLCQTGVPCEGRIPKEAGA
jgi:epoxyqueuosine reductase